MQKKKHILPKIFLVLLISLIIFALFFFFYVKFGLRHEIDLSLLNVVDTSVTKIYAFERNDGLIDLTTAKELEGERIFLENSEWCSFENIPQNLKNAFIAIEDHKFYEHKGVNWSRTIKATLEYIFNFGKASFGGSTITQQLVKNLTGDDMVTPKRKLEEIIRAQNLEKKLSKNEILELYLNVVYLSQNCYGVQSASQIYFAKDASELSLAECATLASIVKNPTRYDPYNFPENNISRRNLVLEQMLAQKMITSEEFENAINESIVINSNIEKEKSSGVYSWFTEKLIDDVTNDLIDRYNLSREGALMLVNKAGLKIYSTIDENVQKSVEKSFENYIAYLKPQNGKYPEASCVVLDNATGDILGIAGGVGKKSANRIFNRATNAKRPLGSVIKPLSVYAPAIENGIITYASVYDDVPGIKNDSFWPHNANHLYKGLVSVNYALEHSLNTVAVKVLNDYGIDNSYEFCKNKFKLNLTQNDKNEAPLALGQLTEGETLLNVTKCYTAFANGGILSKPRSYLYVTDSNDNVILSNDYYGERIISADCASLMNIMLENVVENGTAKGLTLKSEIQVAGKTGTSGENKDKWFIGYTPYYTCGIWVGYDIPQSITASSNSALTLFDTIMKKAHVDKDKNATIFNSANLEIREFCVDSGKIPTESCKIDPRLNRVQTGYFIRGTEPVDKCDRHKEVYIDSHTGFIVENNKHSLFKRRISLVDYSRASEFSSINPYDEEYLLKSRKNN